LPISARCAPAYIAPASADWMIVEPINARSMLDAAAASATAAAGAPSFERRRRLSQAALRVAIQKVGRAYSPVVIAGIVRIADFAMLSCIGVGLYLGYVAPIAGFHWEYVVAILTMTLAAVVCFQAADIYDVQIFRGQLRQMTRMISSWAFVFLLFIGVSFFAKLGNEISRLWLSAFFFIGLAALIAGRLFLRTLVRYWARQGRLHRRTVVGGAAEWRTTDRSAECAGRLRHRYPRRVRRPQRRPFARYLCEQAEARQG
jgi:hypothetical protein